jgi:hypothetical protein
VAEAERRSREQLLNIANAYFDALERGDASTVQFDAACQRLENGTQMTNNPTPNAKGIDPRALSCVDQITSKVMTHYQAVYPRRVPVIDEERQLVFGMFMLQQPGDMLEVASPGRGVYRFPDASSEPGFVQMAQMFKVQAGRIVRMEALTTALPYGTPDPYFKDDWRRAKQ